MSARPLSQPLPAVIEQSDGYGFTDCRSGDNHRSAVIPLRLQKRSVNFCLPPVTVPNLLKYSGSYEKKGMAKDYGSHSPLTWLHHEAFENNQNNLNITIIEGGCQQAQLLSWWRIKTIWIYVKCILTSAQNKSLTPVMRTGWTTLAADDGWRECGLFERVYITLNQE